MAKPFYPFVVTATTPTKITSSARFHRVETNTLLDQQYHGHSIETRRIHF